MRKSGAVPDAWDDDWVTNADSSTRVTDPPPSGKKLSKAERRARQAELNRQLWEDAEAPKDSYFLNTRDDVPLKTDFKPAVKVLSRKPTLKASGVVDSTGSQQLNLEDDEDEDETDSGKTIMTLEERQQKAVLDREEKQKKYEEVRQRLFGSGGPIESQPGENSTSLPALQNGAARGRSKSRGGRETRPSPSTGNRSRQLFDPSSNSKPDPAYIQKKENLPRSGSSTPVKQQIIRSPRGPSENTGRASFGFVPREGI